MKITNFFALLAITMLFLPCCSDDNPNIYDNCCSIPPVEMDYTPGKVYIPNIISPNQDGHNDGFRIYADDGIERIVDFKIFNIDENIVFQENNVSPNSFEAFWVPGTDDPNGMYKYKITVRNTNDEEFDIIGNICAFNCDASNPFCSFDKCGWASQHDGNGGFDPNLPTFQDPCQ